MPCAPAHPLSWSSPRQARLPPQQAAPSWLLMLLAAACGLIAANIYYAQPLAGPISASLGLSPAAAGLIVTLTQIGYGLGLLFIVPLGDLIENRRLTLTLLALVTLSLLAAGLSTHPAPFLLSALGIELAIENFGATADSVTLLERLPVNYVKIDGALMQGLANDRPLQEKVKTLVEAARKHGITTIAERVEDANTMAVLWQLGIEFVQGYFVNNPEEVVM